MGGAEAGGAGRGEVGYVGVQAGHCGRAGKLGSRLLEECLGLAMSTKGSFYPS